MFVSALRVRLAKHKAPAPTGNVVTKSAESHAAAVQRKGRGRWGCEYSPVNKPAEEYGGGGQLLHCNYKSAILRYFFSKRYCFLLFCLMSGILFLMALDGSDFYVNSILILWF